LRGDGVLDSIEIFISYAPEDEKLREKLVSHLAALKRQGLVHIWYNHKITPGLDRQAEIDRHLHTAQIILLLVSADFIDSDYCYSVEMQQAIERHKNATARIISILLRPVYWQGTPLELFPMLPEDAIPVTRHEDQDEAMLEVVEKIVEIARESFLRSVVASTIPTQIAFISFKYGPSRVGNRGIASFVLNGQEHVLHYTRVDSIRKFLTNKNLDSLRHQTILLTYNQQELVREEVPELAPLKTIEKRHRFQIEGVDCLFTFKMLAFVGIMSARLEVGGVKIFSV
jgi:hypothetical protein